MGLFKTKTNIVNFDPAVNITNPLVVPVGSIILIGDKAYRAETYALVEIPVQTLEEAKNE